MLKTSWNKDFHPLEAFNYTFLISWQDASLVHPYLYLINDEWLTDCFYGLAVRSFMCARVEDFKQMSWRGIPKDHISLKDFI